MSVKQNAIDFAMDYPLAIDAVNRTLMDDGLTGADFTEEAIELQKLLQDVFSFVASCCVSGIQMTRWSYSTYLLSFKTHS